MGRSFAHPNVIKTSKPIKGDIYGEGAEGFAMEDAPHGDLDAIFTRMQALVAKGKLTREQQLLVTRHLISGGMMGLEAVHKQDWVHADVKHKNFLLGKDLDTLLMDFDLSLYADKDREPELLGTPGFVAPKVQSGKTAPTKKSDIWSMGETALRALFSEEEASELKRTGKSQSGMDSWHGNLAKRAKVFKNSPHYQSFCAFIKMAMAADPKDRKTATECLKSEFLTLSKGDVQEAKKALQIVLKS